MVVSALTTGYLFHRVAGGGTEDHVKRWLLGETVPGRYQLEALAQILKVEIRVSVTTRGHSRVYPHRRPANDGLSWEGPAGGRAWCGCVSGWNTTAGGRAGISTARQLAQRLDDYVLAKDPDSMAGAGSVAVAWG